MANPQPDKHTRLSNEILEKLARIRIPGEARQMLDVILRKTYGWSKKNDDIATSQFMQFTGMAKAAIHRARKKLLNMNLITITKKDNSTVTEKGYSQILNYTFQKDYDKWQPLPKKVTVTKKETHYNQKRSQTVTEKVTHKRKKETITKDIYISIINHFNEIFKTTYKTTTTSVHKLIEARLKEGFTLDDFKHVHKAIYLKWANNSKMVDYMRPHTLYTGKFESYLNAPETKEKSFYEQNVKE